MNAPGGIDFPLRTGGTMKQVFAMLAIASAIGAAAAAQAHNRATDGPVSGQPADTIQLAQGGGGGGGSGGGGSSGSSGAATMPQGGADANPQDQKGPASPGQPPRPGETPTNNPPSK
jgi:hypothetical protein